MDDYVSRNVRKVSKVHVHRRQYRSAMYLNLESLFPPMQQLTHHYSCPRSCNDVAVPELLGMFRLPMLELTIGPSILYLLANLTT